MTTPAATPLTDRDGIGHTLWRLRHAAGMTPDGLAARLRMSRSGVYRRETHGHLPAAALVEHLHALGYELVARPRPWRSTGTGWPA